MININKDTCIGCRLCTKDCGSQIIGIVDGKASLLPGMCLACGHCVAVCPTGSIKFDNELYTEADLSEIEPINNDKQITPDNLLTMYKSRRSIRQFSDKDIEPEKLQYILDAIKYAPTGKNFQATRITLVKDKLPEFTHTCVDVLAGFADELPENATDELKFLTSFCGDAWKGMKHALDTEGKDLLLYNCKALIVISGLNAMDGGIAGAYAELMCHSLGLGCVYLGFVKMSAESDEIRRILDIKDGHCVACTLAIGYPDVKYNCTLPRKEREITVL